VLQAHFHRVGEKCSAEGEAIRTFGYIVGGAISIQRSTDRAAALQEHCVQIHDGGDTEIDHADIPCCGIVHQRMYPPGISPGDHERRCRASAVDDRCKALAEQVHHFMISWDHDATVGNCDQCCSTIDQAD